MSETEMWNVEHGLRSEQEPDQSPTWTRAERMAHHRVPGLSLAVISEFRIAWANGYGLANAETGAPVTTDTIFQAASISKAVTAAGALRAVEEGRLALDEDINRALRSWRLPENEHTAAAPVTLRGLLGHTAGTTVSGFPGYLADAPLPTLLQVLDGQAPANTPPIRVDLRPGTAWRYSGGGYCIVQQALMDRWGEPFQEIMEARVLAPVGMKSSFFTERLKGPRVRRAAWAHRSSGAVLESRWLGFPELAAAGMWSTADDLARFVVALQRALRGDARGGIAPRVAAQMLSTSVSDGYGLGLQLLPRNGEVYFSHGGSNPGYTCLFVGHRTAGCGAVMMANSEHGFALFPELLAAIAAEYGWPGYFPQGE